MNVGAINPVRSIAKTTRNMVAAAAIMVTPVVKGVVYNGNADIYAKNVTNAYEGRILSASKLTKPFHPTITNKFFIPVVDGANYGNITNCVFNSIKRDNGQKTTELGIKVLTDRGYISTIKVPVPAENSQAFYKAEISNTNGVCNIDAGDVFNGKLINPETQEIHWEMPNN